MNPKNLFALDFAKSSIVASATTLRKARNPESPECKALMRMLSEHPSFHVAEKEIRKKSGKQTYKGLTFQAMTDYIQTQPNSKDEIRKYEVVRHIAKIKGSEYALTKKWFLNAYPAYKEKAIVEQEMDEMLQAEKAPISTLPAAVGL